MKFQKILSEKRCMEYVRYFDDYNYDDVQVSGSRIIRNYPLVMEVCKELKPIIEKNISFDLEPIQGWIRKYVRGNVLHKHWDGKADCAFSIMLKQSDEKENPLLIYYEDVPESIILNVGDGYFFEGGTIEHERPPIQSDYLYGMYLGYRKIKRETKLL